MSTYTIGEVADRSGFSPSALRYYEGIGLLAPAARTGAGYRVYDGHTLTRLAFIARAKQLGCSLGEIIDLVGIWDGERCGPVQRRFHDLVTDKIGVARRQIGELTALTAELQAAASQLRGQPVDGPCGADCACVGDAASTATSVAAGDKPSDPPVACTLPPGDVTDRLADWQAVLEHVRARTRLVDGSLRVELDEQIALDELTRLVAAEQRCCEFFAFSITIDARGIALEVRAPDGATEIVASLFGRPAQPV